MLDNHHLEVTDYMRGLGMKKEAFEAATDYAQWSATAEYRMLSRAGTMVDEIPMEELRAFLGRGSMLELK